MKPQEKSRRLQLRHWRLRKKVAGTAARPRMSVKFTGTHIYVQFVDDAAGRTLAAAGTRDKAAPQGVKGANARNAVVVGKRAAEAARAAGIEQVVFDRSGARYHGKVKALADAAREAGLKF
ncbi:MAG TPA: 50S ribosomal protein L18 [Verrucomicrobiota bacterium]|nr:50S ribosomal protein L18 [Verrucomicrobiota bacterium]